MEGAAGHMGPKGGFCFCFMDRRDVTCLHAERARREREVEKTGESREVRGEGT